MRIEGGNPRLLNGRPLTVPFEALENAPCDRMLLQLPPGSHSLTLSQLVYGYSALASETATGWFPCHFVAEPNHRYAVAIGAFGCVVEDETLGRQVSEEAICVAHPGRSTPCPEEKRIAAEFARLEVLKAYSACGDANASSDLESMRSIGSVPLHPEEWRLPECEPIFDLRSGPKNAPNSEPERPAELHPVIRGVAIPDEARGVLFDLLQATHEPGATVTQLDEEGDRCTLQVEARSIKNVRRFEDNLTASEDVAGWTRLPETNAYRIEIATGSRNQAGSMSD